MENNPPIPILLAMLCTGWHKTIELWPPAREDIIDLEIKLFCLARSRGRAEAAPSFKHSPNDLGGGTGDRQPLWVRARMVQPKGNFQGGLEDIMGMRASKHSSLCFLSILYGGAHCGAWNTHLPTQVERMLWRYSAAIAGLFISIYCAFGICYFKLMHYRAVHFNI